MGYGIGAMDQSRSGYRSVMSQLASAVVGNGPLYYVAIGSLLCVLALSANTSFVDFPERGVDHGVDRARAGSPAIAVASRQRRAAGRRGSGTTSCASAGRTM